MPSTAMSSPTKKAYNEQVEERWLCRYHGVVQGVSEATERKTQKKIVCDKLGYTDDAVDNTRVCTEWCLPWTPLVVSIMGKDGW
jgi:hypothetical protein